MTDADAVEAFIAEHGVKRCPPAFGAASSAYLPDAAAKEAIKRLPALDCGLTNWSNRLPKTKRPK